MPRVVIVGAGMSGLSLAYRLQQHGPNLDVQVLEECDRAGGKIGSYRRDGFLVETGPNGFLDNKTFTVDLCRELGLADQLVAASPEAGKNRYLFLGDRLKRLPANPLEFLKSGLLSWHGKLDLIREFFRPRRRDGPEESIAAFARRRIGPEATEVLVDAVVTGIHAGDPELLSMAACFPRLVELEARHGSVLKGLKRNSRRHEKSDHLKKTGSHMWSLQPGLGTLVETLCSRLRHAPLFGVSVRSLQRNENSWTVLAGGKDAWEADAVVLTCPAYQQAAILADLDGTLAERVGSIAYNSIAVLALGYRRQDVPVDVAGFGYIAPQRTRRDVLGVQWCSSIYPGRAPDGTVLLRAMAGGWHRPELAHWDDDRLLHAVRTELRLAMGITAPPIFQHIVRWNRAIPQYHLGHLEKVAWIEERVARYPGLFLAGNAYHGVAMNDCTEQAESLEAKVASFIEGT